MAHVEKYTIGAVGHMFKHYERAKDDKGEYIKFGNQNIDLTKTNTNYNMATDQQLPQLAFINKRLKEVKVQQRKDVNVMCSWVVTLPQGMLMYGKEASNRKQEIDRQHYTIPNQRPKDKHCGKI